MSTSRRESRINKTLNKHAHTQGCNLALSVDRLISTWYHIPVPPWLFLALFLASPAFLAWFFALFLAALIALLVRTPAPLATQGHTGTPLAPGKNRADDCPLISAPYCSALNLKPPKWSKSVTMLNAVRMYTKFRISDPILKTKNCDSYLIYKSKKDSKLKYHMAQKQERKSGGQVDRLFFTGRYTGWSISRD